MASNDNTVLSTTNTDFSERSEGFASDQQFLDTPGSFFTATPGYSVGNPTPHEPSADSEYGLLLRENKLLVARDVELNWSGKGQHVEYKIGEAIPLDVIKTIGHSATALVEAVRCRRILLARKSIQCNRYVKLPQLISEVEHLHRLRHPHIIQLVGSYLHNKAFAMLLYPVADYDLSVFMDKVSEAIRKRPKYSLTIQWARHLSKFFLCLAHALKYMHSQGTMHMDIKPSNILVKGPGFSSWLSFKVYIADFNISRKFLSEEGSQTDDSIGMTQKWCSPEVFEQEARGRSADVFSLGCVFLEMYTVLVSDTLDNFSDFRGEGGDSAAFHSSLPRVKYWIDKLRETQIRLTSTSERGYLYEFVLALPPLEFLDLIVKMVERDPKGRPTMLDVVQRMEILTNDIVPILANRMNDYSWRASRWKCCEQEREVYDVAEKDFTWINTFALHRAERNPTDPIQSR